MLHASEVSGVKVLNPVRMVLGQRQDALSDIVRELFNSNTLILPVELLSIKGSHWVFLIIDSQIGTVKLLDTENSHESTIVAFLSNSVLSTWPLSSIDIDHQLYSDSCGVEGVSQLISYLKNTSSMDPESAAVVQGVTSLDYLTVALKSIFNVDHFYRIKDYLLAQVNKFLNFALDTNNKALIVDLINQADSIQSMTPLVLGRAPFKPDYDAPGDYFGGGDDGTNLPVQGSIGLAGNQHNKTNHTCGEYL